jgi:hypothetical protein
MENSIDQYHTQVFYSKTLRNFFNKLDATILNLEAENVELEEKIKELEAKLIKVQAKELQDMNFVIANSLLACVGKAKVTNSDTGIILANIRELETVEQVRDYINEILKNS